MRSLARWLCPLLLLVALPLLARDYRFDGSMSEEVLRNYLSRSMTTMYLLTGHGDFDDNLRMLTNCGVKFAGRAVYQWGREEGGESALPKKLELAKKWRTNPEKRSCGRDTPTQYDDLQRWPSRASAKSNHDFTRLSVVGCSGICLPSMIALQLVVIVSASSKLICGNRHKSCVGPVICQNRAT